MNLRMDYLYRDAGNYKNWGEVVFANPASAPNNRNVLIRKIRHTVLSAASPCDKDGNRVQSNHPPAKPGAFEM